MRTKYTDRVSAQQKIISVNNRFGNGGLKKQQGSTVEVFDMVELDVNKTTYELFHETANKVFPFTNLKNGQLQPQESFAMERMYIFIATRSIKDNKWIEVRPLDLATDFGMSMGEFEFNIENQRVLKPFPVRSFFPEFNSDSESNVQSVLEFDTQIVIPPLLNFKASFKFPLNSIIVPENKDQVSYIGCTIGGAGGIFAPKSNF